MSASKPAFRRPKFRDGVTCQLTTSGATIDYRHQGCELDFSSEAAPHMGILLDSLRAGDDIDALTRRVPVIAEQIPGVLDDLDRLGLLVECDIEFERGGVSGAEFYRVVRRFNERLRERHAHNEFYDALASGRATRDQIIGYAIEYYHVVRMAPGLIAPALAHAGSPTTQSVLQKFLASELGHDRLLLASLRAVGIEEQHLEFVQPLPSTFAICSALGVFAAQDPLTFKACLFIYEDVDDRFSLALSRRCGELGMPSAFVEPILQHADVNEGANHGNISQQLLSELPYIGVEEQRVTLKHIAVLIETLVNSESEILRHYAPDRTFHGGNGVPS